MKLSPAAKKALMLGSMCTLSYLAVYVARNILGAASPQMIEGGSFTTESIGTLSSIYFFTYAFGQLINGRIGDKIKSRYMISAGLIFAGVCNSLFSLSNGSPALSLFAYAMTGYFLSMIYGPVTKVVAENTEPIYATRCSLGYTFASFFGTPLAGILAAVLAWQGVFAASSAILITMGVMVFLSFLRMEKRGLVVYRNKSDSRQPMAEGLKKLLDHHIIKYSFVSILTGIIRTTVVFWVPTYLAQY